MNIAIVNKSTIPLGVDLDSMIQATQVQMQRDFAPAWRVDVNLIKLDDFTDEYATCVLVDNPDQAAALGYHEVSPNGHPIGKVFCKLILQSNEKISPVFGHEVQEMAGNPFVDKIAVNPRNKYAYAVESTDPDQSSSYQINGIDVSNFVYPSWFNPNASSSEKFDFLGNIKAPFVLARGGYANIKRPNGVWDQIFADQMAYEKFHSKDHDRSPQIIAAKKAFASLKPFDPSKYPVIKAY